MILINGYFHCRRINGIERYAYEITKRLDNICKKGEISIIIPKNINNSPRYTNINVIRYGKKLHNILWQMIILQWFLFKNRKYTVLDFGNTILPFAPGIVFLHDIYCELFAEDFKNLKEKVIRAYNRFQYRLISSKAKHIITVSEYSRNEIINSFKINLSKISVIYSAADHVNSIKTDFSIFNKYPILKNKSFYFSLGSLSKRKNINWIIKYARKNPNDIFAISGTSLPAVKVDELDNNKPDNVILLGYLEDSKVKALMERCKAFLHPSYYEGFGLTPLEALSCGAEIIISNTASLPEIYGNTAHYINPDNININLDVLLNEPVLNPDFLFEKYTFRKSAEKLYKIILEYD